MVDLLLELRNIVSNTPTAVALKVDQPVVGWALAQQ